MMQWRFTWMVKHDHNMTDRRMSFLTWLSARLFFKWVFFFFRLFLFYTSSLFFCFVLLCYFNNVEKVPWKCDVLEKCAKIRNQLQCKLSNFNEIIRPLRNHCSKHIFEHFDTLVQDFHSKMRSFFVVFPFRKMKISKTCWDRFSN